MIVCNNLTKQFGETCACAIPELKINDGEIIGLVGNNGAGKTTLFRIILDLLQPETGSVTNNGIDVAASEDWKDFTGAYIDEGFLIDFLTPEEYFDFLAKISSIDKETAAARLADFEAFCNGEVFGGDKLIRNLSAGNKQKVGIISALFAKPKVVILDEPFNFLDPSSQMRLKQLLTDYQAQTGATIIVSSHNLQHTTDISTRVLLLEHGRIIEDIDNTQGAAAEQLAEYFNAI